MAKGWKTERVRLVQGMYVEGNKIRGRSEKKQRDVIASDICWADRIKWKCRTRVTDLKQFKEKATAKKKKTIFFLL